MFETERTRDTGERPLPVYPEWEKETDGDCRPVYRHA